MGFYKCTDPRVAIGRAVVYTDSGGFTEVSQVYDYSPLGLFSSVVKQKVSFCSIQEVCSFQQNKLAHNHNVKGLIIALVGYPCSCSIDSTHSLL